MAGFFPVMMFGLPAACLAMYHTALPDRRKAVAGMLLSLALTSFLTGVTEPIEFSFMFLAPALYLLHAVLTGLSMVVMNVLGVKLGFGFSAGLFDYVLGFGISTRPLAADPRRSRLFRGLLLLVPLVHPALRPQDAGPRRRRGRSRRAAPATERAAAISRWRLAAQRTLRTVDACMTRLRLTLNDPEADR